MDPNVNQPANGTTTPSNDTAAPGTFIPIEKPRLIRPNDHDCYHTNPNLTRDQALCILERIIGGCWVSAGSGEEGESVWSDHSPLALAAIEAHTGGLRELARHYNGVGFKPLRENDPRYMESLSGVVTTKQLARVALLLRAMSEAILR